jgi:hypothetical protein
LSTDTVSGVKRYFICISTTTEDNLVVSDAVIMHPTSFYVFYNAEHGKTYYAKLKVEDNAGNVSDYSNYSSGVMVDTTPPLAVPWVNDGTDLDIQWTTTSNKLSANWSEGVDPESGVNAYYVSISSTAPGLDDFIPWTVITTTAVTFTNLSLCNGVTYYFNVRVKNNAGLLSNITSSNGQCVDITIPQPSQPIAKEEYISTTTVKWNWEPVFDYPSGVKCYYICVSTIDGGDIIKDLPLSTTYYFYYNATTGVKYYAKLKVEDNAGNISGYSAYSDGVMVDTTPPTAIISVIDGLEEDIDISNSSYTLSAKWTGSVDEESGILTYLCSISTSPDGSFVDWIDVGLSTTITISGLNLISGVTYYFAVKSQNKAKLYSSISISDGVLIDYTPPLCPGIPQLVGSYKMNYSSSSVLTWTWEPSIDYESVLNGYYFTIGSQPDSRDVVYSSFTTINIFTFQNGVSGKTYYARVCAQDLAGNISIFSDSIGVMVDTTPPVAVKNVRDGFKEDILFSTYPTQLAANWDVAIDNESGIAGYWYTISTSPVGNPLINWEFTTSTYVVVSNLSLINGTTYYFIVRPENNAGLLGDPTISNGQIVDISIPEVFTPQVCSVYSATTTLKWEWLPSFDFPSGIKGYYIQISSKADFSSIVTEEWIGNTTYYYFYDGKNGTRYFAIIKAEDNAGNISQYSSVSDGILVDTSPPNMPVLVYPEDDFWTDSTILSFDWSDVTDEPENSSGINYYKFELSTTSVFSTIFYTTSSSSEFTIKEPLTPYKYFWRVMVEDNAGNFVFSSTRSFVIASTKSYILLVSTKTFLKADGNDSCVITAYIMDINGNVYKGATDTIFFNLEGPGILVGENPINAQNGQASIILKSTTTEGEITVTASAIGLIDGKIVIKTKKIGVPVRIKLDTILSQIQADGISVTTITAKVVDMEDNVVDITTAIRFDIVVSTPDIDYARTHSSLNYAYGKKVIFSGETGVSIDTISYINDNDEMTEWIITKKDVPAWVMIDLGNEKNVNWIQYVSRFKQKYVIELIDGNENVVYVIDNKNTFQPSGVSDFLFLTKKARYVKLIIYDAENSPYIGCSELKVYYVDIFPGYISSYFVNFATINSIAIASTQEQNELLRNINDEDDTTQWMSSIKPAWVKIDFIEPRHVKKIRYFGGYRQKYKIELLDESEKIVYVLDYSNSFQPEELIYDFPFLIPNIKSVKLTLYESEEDSDVHCYELSVYGPPQNQTYEVALESGVAVVNFHSSVNSVVCKIVATAKEKEINGDSLTIQTLHGTPTQIRGYANPKIITADGVTISTITAYICDANKNIVKNANNIVTFSIVRGFGSLSNGTTSYAINAVDGIATSVYYTSKIGKTEIYVVSPGLISDFVEIQAKSGTPFYLRIEVSSNIAIANDTPILIKLLTYDSNCNEIISSLEDASGIFSIYCGDLLVDKINTKFSNGMAAVNYISPISGRLKIRAELSNNISISTETFVTFIPNLYSTTYVYCEEDSGLTRIEIPPRTFVEPVEVIITKVSDKEDPNITILKGRTREIKIYKLTNGVRTEEYKIPLSKNIKLIFYYTDEEYVNGLSIFKWDETKNKWQWQPNFGLVKDHKYLYLETNKLGIYSIGYVNPKQTILYQNYPNPFFPRKDKNTTIVFDLDEGQNISIKIYNISGELVRTLVDNKYYNIGRYKINWDGKNENGDLVASGIYLCNIITSNGYKKTIKIAVIK